MQLNVTSEIGRLKSVLVHLPGREIDLMVPPMMAQLLFDDILYGQVAREEHRRFQQLIRFVADDVLDIAAGGLTRRAFLNSAGDNEGGFLDPLRDVVASGMTPADRLLAKYHEWNGDVSRIYEEFSF